MEIIKTIFILVAGIILAALGWGLILKGIPGLFDTEDDS